MSASAALGCGKSVILCNVDTVKPSPQNGKYGESVATPVDQVNVSSNSLSLYGRLGQSAVRQRIGKIPRKIQVEKGSERKSATQWVGDHNAGLMPFDHSL